MRYEVVPRDFFSICCIWSYLARHDGTYYKPAYILDHADCRIMLKLLVNHAT